MNVVRINQAVDFSYFDDYWMKVKKNDGKLSNINNDLFFSTACNLRFIINSDS